MKYLQKIRKLYHLQENEMLGFTESEMEQLEKRLKSQLPKNFKSYYTTLGKCESLNYSYNRLLKPDQEIGFSKDKYLVFYEENQAVTCWAIKQGEFALDNPPVWGNYGTTDRPDWHMETKTLDDFFLLMAVYNGTLGGLAFHANSLEPIKPETIKYIEENWNTVEEISWEGQKVYENAFEEVISVSYDEHQQGIGIFIGTNDQKRFDKLLQSLDVDWSYISDEDEYYENS